MLRHRILFVLAVLFCFAPGLKSRHLPRGNSYGNKTPAKSSSGPDGKSTVEPMAAMFMETEEEVDVDENTDNVDEIRADSHAEGNEINSLETEMDGYANRKDEEPEANKEDAQTMAEIFSSSIEDDLKGPTKNYIEEPPPGLKSTVKLIIEKSNNNNNQKCKDTKTNSKNQTIEVTQTNVNGTKKKLVKKEKDTSELAVPEEPTDPTKDDEDCDGLESCGNRKKKGRKQGKTRKAPSAEDDDTDQELDRKKRNSGDASSVTSMRRHFVSAGREIINVNHRAGRQRMRRQSDDKCDDGKIDGADIDADGGNRDDDTDDTESDEEDQREKRQQRAAEQIQRKLKHMQPVGSRIHAEKRFIQLRPKRTPDENDDDSNDDDDDDDTSEGTAEIDNDFFWQQAEKNLEIGSKNKDGDDDEDKSEDKEDADQDLSFRRRRDASAPRRQKRAAETGTARVNLASDRGAGLPSAYHSLDLRARRALDDDDEKEEDGDGDSDEDVDDTESDEDEDEKDQSDDQEDADDSLNADTRRKRGVKTRGSAFEINSGEDDGLVVNSEKDSVSNCLLRRKRGAKQLETSQKRKSEPKQELEQSKPSSAMLSDNTPGLSPAAHLLHPRFKRGLSDDDDDESDDDDDDDDIGEDELTSSDSTEAEEEDDGEDDDSEAERRRRRDAAVLKTRHGREMGLTGSEDSLDREKRKELQKRAEMDELSNHGRKREGAQFLRRPRRGHRTDTGPLAAVSDIYPSLKERAKRAEGSDFDDDIGDTADDNGAIADADAKPAGTPDFEQERKQEQEETDELEKALDKIDLDDKDKGENQSQISVISKSTSDEKAQNGDDGDEANKDMSEEDMDFAADDDSDEDDDSNDDDHSNERRRKRNSNMASRSKENGESRNIDNRRRESDGNTVPDIEVNVHPHKKGVFNTKVLRINTGKQENTVEETPHIQVLPDGEGDEKNRPEKPTILIGTTLNGPSGHNQKQRVIIKTPERETDHEKTDSEDLNNRERTTIKSEDGDAGNTMKETGHKRVKIIQTPDADGDENEDDSEEDVEEEIVKIKQPLSESTKENDGNESEVMKVETKGANSHDGHDSNKRAQAKSSKNPDTRLEIKKVIVEESDEDGEEKGDQNADRVRIIQQSKEKRRYLIKRKASVEANEVDIKEQNTDFEGNQKNTRVISRYSEGKSKSGEDDDNYDSDDDVMDVDQTQTETDVDTETDIDDTTNGDTDNSQNDEIDETVICDKMTKSDSEKQNGDSRKENTDTNNKNNGTEEKPVLDIKIPQTSSKEKDQPIEITQQTEDKNHQKHQEKIKVKVPKSNSAQAIDEKENGIISPSKTEKRLKHKQKTVKKKKTKKHRAGLRPVEENEKDSTRKHHKTVHIKKHKTSSHNGKKGNDKKRKKSAKKISKKSKKKTVKDSASKKEKSKEDLNPEGSDETEEVKSESSTLETDTMDQDNNPKSEEKSKIGQQGLDTPGPEGGDELEDQITIDADDKKHGKNNVHMEHVHVAGKGNEDIDIETSEERPPRNKRHPDLTATEDDDTTVKMQGSIDNEEADDEDDGSNDD